MGKTRFEEPEHVKAHVAAIGANCGRSLEDMERVVQEFVALDAGGSSPEHVAAIAASKRRRNSYASPLA